MISEGAQQHRHKESRTAKNADQIEAEAIERGSVVIDRGVYDDRVSGAMDDYEPIDAEAQAPWHVIDLAGDDAVGQAHEEIERRQSLLKDAYPYKLSNGSLTYAGPRSGFYEFCLAAAMKRDINRKPYVRLPRVFERVSAILVASAFGEDTEHLHLGSPRDTEIGSAFSEAMIEANKRTKEFFWGPDQGLPQKPTHTGDEGVDFIVWKRPPDQRVGSLFVLGQCACGDDWSTKFGDIDIERFSRWFSPMCYVRSPVRAFTTPYHLGDGWLLEALTRAGLVFDRVRLTLLAEQVARGETYTEWRPKIDEAAGLVFGGTN